MSEIHSFHSSGGATSSTPERARVVKFILLGNSGVGKTSILCRFCDGTHNANTTATIGVDFKWREINIDGEPVRLHVWDTAGQEQFRSMSKSYYRHADGVVLVYDVTDPSSMTDLDSFIEDARQHCNLGVPMVLLGNKFDLSGQTPTPTTSMSDTSVSSPGQDKFSRRGLGSRNARYSSPGNNTSERSVGSNANASGLSRYSSAPRVVSSTNVVPKEDGERFAKKRGIPIFFQTSAVDGTHIDEAFDILCRHVLNNSTTNNDIEALTDATIAKNSPHRGANSKSPVRLMSNADAAKHEKARKGGKGEKGCKC